MKTKQTFWHTITDSIMHTVYFNDLEQMADFLGIRGLSRKAIYTNCKKRGFGLCLDSNKFSDMKYDLEFKRV